MKRKAKLEPSIQPWEFCQLCVLFAVSSIVGNVIGIWLVDAVTWLRTHLHVCFVLMT